MTEENEEKRYCFPQCQNKEIIESDEFTRCLMCETFKGFLKPEARITLNNLNNYLIKVSQAEPSICICKYCNKRIAQSILPLILWNKDKIHFIEFHMQCIVKKEKLKEFFDFIDDFDYVYEIDE